MSDPLAGAPGAIDAMAELAVEGMPTCRPGRIVVATADGSTGTADGCSIPKLLITSPVVVALVDGRDRHGIG